MDSAHLVRRKFHDRLVLDIIESTDLRESFREDVLRGFTSDPKTIPPKYFYDERGSQLFEAITGLEEYYPTRTEAAILAQSGEEMLDAAGPGLTVVELGSGSSTKTRLLLERLAGRQERVDYIPIDISPTVVTEFGEQLLQDYPSLHIRGLICDYDRALGELKEQSHERKLFLFLGSSMGNFTPHQAAALLRVIREAMGPQDSLLLGVDLKKDRAILERAYDDAQGVTAAFNLNLLERINRELGGQFDVERFRHVALYNAQQGRIEMHLESTVSQIVPIDALGRSFTFRRGERIHTENSYKFDREQLQQLLGLADMTLQRQWLDPQGWFSLSLASPV
ncbi:MAG TPA: L-histidine N(alpha)-methyltransferase [bacterium]|nr:L-histidine N(alpha)-methyltransferase [bacterium]